MQIPIKSKTPKIASGIAVTILIISIGWFSLSQFWFWVSLEIVAAVLVAVGCSGEWWLHHHPAGKRKKEKHEHHKLESRFIAMVALGVIMELFALGNAIREGAMIDRTTKQLVSSNFELQVQLQELVSTNLELRSQLLSIANEAALNSPSNFPISSAWGSGYIVLSKDSSIEPSNLFNKSAMLELIPEVPQNSVLNFRMFGGVMVQGKTLGVRTNRLGKVEVSFVFEESNLRTVGAGPIVTFNNLKFCRLDLCSDGSFRRKLHVEKGFLSLELNPSFEYGAEIKFPEQTNSIIEIIGIRSNSPF